MFTPFEKLQSRITDRCTTRLSDRLRSQFTSVPLPDVKPVQAHSHGKAAAARSSAVAFMDGFASAVGLDTYHISMSANDSRRGRRGNRLFFDAKDTSMAYHYDALRNTDLISLVDVDYYIDMPKLLRNTNNSVIMYTVTPEDVGGVIPDGMFYFKDGRYNELIKGGAAYNHELWDYSNDYLTVCGWVGRKLARKMYKIEKRKVTESRSLILLQLTSITSCCGLVFGAGLPPKPLSRLSVLRNDFNIMRVVSDDMYVSVSRNGSTAAVRVPIATYDALRSVQNVSKKTLTKATVETYLKGGSRASAAVVTDMLMHCDPTFVPPTSVVSDIGIASYQYIKDYDSYDEDAPDVMVSFMSPFLGESPAPQDCLNNDIRCVDKRINEIKHVKPRHISKFTLECIEELSDFLVNSDARHNLVPLDVESVFLRQNRPAQQNILDDAVVIGDHERRVTISSFMKRECYGKVNDPRNISTFPGRVKLDYSRFVYAVTDYMKDNPKFAWYAFGRTPANIAQNVARVCREALKLLVTDYSRMDGRKSNISRLFFRTFMMKLFREEYLDQLDELLKLQINRKGWTKHGVSYDSGLTQGSGGADTSVSNSLDTCLGAYLGARYAGKSKAEALSFIMTKFMAGGDDAIMADIEPERVSSAARTVGHVLTFETYNRGDPGVNFLSRVYSPEVWTGSPVSMCDFKRQMLKFHATPIRGVNYRLTSNRLNKLAEKAVSFVLTDRKTPILGEFCERFLRNAQVDVDAVLVKVKTGERWWSRFDSSEQFPQDNGSWMVDVIKSQLPTLNFEVFDKWISEDMKADDFLSPPLLLDEFLEFKAPDMCVVNDRLGELTISSDVDEEAATPRTASGSSNSLPDSGVASTVRAPERKGAPNKKPPAKPNQARTRGKGSSKRTKRSVRGKSRKAPS